MKKLSELGISPAPWRVKHHTEESSDEFEVFSADGKYVGPIAIGYGISKSMANFLAAAPDMYAAIWDILFKCTKITNCRNCKGAELGNCKACPLGKARAALAKASGESEVHHD